MGVGWEAEEGEKREEDVLEEEGDQREERRVGGEGK